MSAAAPIPGVTLVNEDRGEGLKIYLIAMMTMATVSVLLRFWSRALTSVSENRHVPKFWWDDWTALAALPFYIGCIALTLKMIDLGLGKHIWNVPPENIVPSLRLLFGIYLLFDTSLMLAKMSCLLFFTRIFTMTQATARWFRYGVWICHILNVAWYLGIVFGTIFQCKPVEKNWNPALDGHCSPTNALWIGSAVPSVFVDWLILLLPMPMIWKLRMTRQRRMLVTLVFLCGYCVIIVSLGRLITVLKSEDALNADLTYEGVPSLYWLGSEPPFTLLGVCLPTMVTFGRRIMGPAFHKLSTAASSIMGSTFGSRAGTQKSTLQSASSRLSRRDFQSLENDTEQLRGEGDRKSITLTSIHHSKSELTGAHDIHVQKDVLVSSRPMV